MIPQINQIRKHALAELIADKKLTRKQIQQFAKKAFSHHQVLQYLQQQISKGLIPSITDVKQLKQWNGKLILLQGLVLQELKTLLQGICTIKNSQSYSIDNIKFVQFESDSSQQARPLLQQTSLVVLGNNRYKQGFRKLPQQIQNPIIMTGKAKVGQIVRAVGIIYFIEQQIQDELDQERNYSKQVPRFHLISRIQKNRKIKQLKTNKGQQLFNLCLKSAENSRDGLLLLASLISSKQNIFLNLNRYWSLPQKICPYFQLINNIDNFLYYKPYGQQPGKISVIHQPIYIAINLSGMSQGKLTETQTINLLGLKQLVQEFKMEIPWNSGNGSKQIQCFSNGFTVRGFIQSNLKVLLKQQDIQLTDLQLNQFRIFLLKCRQVQQVCKIEPSAKQDILQQYKSKKVGSQQLELWLKCGIALALIQFQQTANISHIRKAAKLLSND